MSKMMTTPRQLIPHDSQPVFAETKGVAVLTIPVALVEEATKGRDWELLS